MPNFKRIFTEQDDLKSKNVSSKMFLELKNAIEYAWAVWKKCTSIHMLYPTGHPGVNMNKADKCSH